MTDWSERCEPIDAEVVLREWIEREARKESYPDADPGDWSHERLVTELSDTYEEPVDPVADPDLDWQAVRLDGEALGTLGTFPEPAWDRLSGDGTVAGAVERVSDPAVAADFPDAAEKIRWFAAHPEHEYGAAVAWQRDGEGPPVLLDGNHRACGLHRAARDGRPVSLAVHIAGGAGRE